MPLKKADFSFMNRDRPWIDRIVAIFMNWPMKIGGCADEALDAPFAEMAVKATQHDIKIGP